MKRIAIIVVSVLVVTTMVLGATMVMAAKPPDVILKSNGFPSGLHFNLNIHGKKADFDCDAATGGHSVFILEYGNSTIQYISNKKAALTELKVLDKCGEDFDGDPAKVQLPYKVEVDGTVIPAEGYYVFARILGKSNNSSNDGDPSSIILYPNVVVQACNDPGDDPNFPDYTDCLLALGLIVGNNLYVADDEEFVRFDPVVTKGKGKSKAKDITDLFMWEGWVCDASLDANDDGVIDESDVPIEYDLIVNGGNNNGAIDEFELENWLDDQVDAGLATYYEKQWIFNIADLVVTEQPVENDGTKLLQVRFYPVATTEFEPQP